MKILWVSRHKMTTDQIKDLERIYGKVEINQMEETIKDVNTIINKADEINSDIIAVVLPIELLAKLIKATDKPIITCTNERVLIGEEINPANGQLEKKFMFKHKCWKLEEEIIIKERIL